MMDEILRNSKWSTDKNCFLSDFVDRYKLPRLALITKGQYLGVGAPNTAAPDLNPYVLVYGTKTVRKLIGRTFKWKDNKILGPNDQKVVISENFNGFFEILSEDGRPMKYIESVRELAELFPDICLVRLAFKAYLPDSDGELRSTYRMRTVKEGEMLTLVGLFHYKNNAFLRCFDDTGKSVFLKINAQSIKCKFSPVAKNENAISGAHKACNLMGKRLPITIRLIRGLVAPNLTFNGHLVVKLESIFMEEDIFSYSISGQKFRAGNGPILQVPRNAHLMLSPICGQTKICANRNDFRDMIRTCHKLVENFYDIIIPFSAQPINVGKLSPKFSNSLDRNVENTGDYCNFLNDKFEIMNDDEIEQLYDYVRGTAPLPVHLSTDYFDPNHYVKSKQPKLMQNFPNKYSKKHRISPEGTTGSSGGPTLFGSGDEPQKATGYSRRKPSSGQVSRLKRFSKSTDKLATAHKSDDQPLFFNEKEIKRNLSKSKIIILEHQNASEQYQRPNSASFNQEFYPAPYDRFYDDSPLNFYNVPMVNTHKYHDFMDGQSDRKNGRINHNEKHSRPYQSCTNLLEINVNFSDE